MADKWIQKAIKKPGALKKELGVPEDEKIPAAKLNAVISDLSKKAKEGELSKKELKTLHRANLAKTLKSFKEFTEEDNLPQTKE